MQYSWSSRVRTAEPARSGRFIPRVDLLEDRLAPGDTILSQVFGLSLFGSSLGFDSSSVPNLPVEAPAVADLRLVQTRLDETALTAAELPVGQTVVVTAGVATLEQAPRGGSEFGPFPTATFSADPLGAALFGAAAATPARGLPHLNQNAPAVLADGAGAAAAGGYGAAVVAAAAPVVALPAGSDLTQALQSNADGSTLVAGVTNPTAAIDHLANISRNGYVPAGFKPQPLTPDQLPQQPVNQQPNAIIAGLQQYLERLGDDPTIQGPGDPAATGPLAVTRIEYNQGDTAFTPPGFPGPVEMQASVHYPTNLPGGPYPLVIFLHGRHATCRSTFTWPCPTGQSPIRSFVGYDYVGRVLASWGFVVASIGANGINARDNNVTDLGALARAQLIQEHLTRWNTWNLTGGGPTGIGNAFIGKVNLQNVGTMGHSRGGEGVIRHFVLNQSLGSPFGLQAVLPLAATDFNRFQIGLSQQLHILPYCDGDVSDLQGMHAYDDALYTLGSGDYAFKTVVTAMGANHNFFNETWTPGSGDPFARDDWTFADSTLQNVHCGTNNPNNRRLTPAQQRAVGLAYMGAFFRLYQGAEYNFLAYMSGDYLPPTVAAFDLRVSYHPISYGSFRMDVNTQRATTNLTTNNLGGAVTQSGLVAGTYELCGGAAPQPAHCPAGQPTSRTPHTVPSARSSAPGMPQLRLVWDNNTASYSNALPAGFRDVSGFNVLQFRTGLNFADAARNPANQNQDYFVTLVDGSGNSVSQAVSWWSTALRYPPGTGSTTPLPKHINNTVRIFIQYLAGINLSDIRTVRIDFGLNGRGHVTLTDLLFTIY